MFQKILITVFVCSQVIILAACGSGPSAPAPSAKPDARTAASPNAAAPSAATSPTTAGAPVELIQSGVTDDKANLAYRIKVNSDKPIDEVHLALKETDAKGKALGTSMIVWQNIVGSTRKPIESGKTYDDQTALDPGAVKAEVSLKEVIFKDGSRWSAK